MLTKLELLLSQATAFTTDIMVTSGGREICFPSTLLPTFEQTVEKAVFECRNFALNVPAAALTQLPNLLLRGMSQ